MTSAKLKVLARRIEKLALTQEQRTKHKLPSPEDLREVAQAANALDATTPLRLSRTEIRKNRRRWVRTVTQMER